ncbi:MAG TPA: prolyl oligopeptidase family serine peptidase [Trebonia sp.]
MVAGAVGRGEWTDILAGVDDLVTAGVADPGRLGIAGWSHGRGACQILCVSSG